MSASTLREVDAWRHSKCEPLNTRISGADGNQSDEKHSTKNPMAWWARLKVYPHARATKGECGCA